MSGDAERVIAAWEGSFAPPLTPRPSDRCFARPHTRRTVRRKVRGDRSARCEGSRLGRGDRAAPVRRDPPRYVRRRARRSPAEGRGVASPAHAGCRLVRSPSHRAPAPRARCFGASLRARQPGRTQPTLPAGWADGPHAKIWDIGADSKGDRGVRRHASYARMSYVWPAIVGTTAVGLGVFHWVCRKSKFCNVGI